VQDKRLALLSNFFRETFALKDISFSLPLRRLLTRRFWTPAYLFCWRSLLNDETCDEWPLEECMTSITSHYNIGGGLNPEKAVGNDPDMSEKARTKAISILSRFKVVTANSRLLANLLKPELPDIIYAPNGVDASFFCPGRTRSFSPRKPRIGWVGKVKAAKNRELIEEAKPLFEEKGIDFREIVLDKSGTGMRTPEEVRDFYHNLDFYLCTSWHEGTPNPCLEAASCGVPLITTRVGNMPELVRDSENSFFIEPTLDSLASSINRIMQISEQEHAALSERVRADIESSWSWADRMEPYREAFERLLA